jgi:DNA-binding PadR family transcriptional regulator
MPVRHGLLALLEREPMYGYQLRVEFEAATGGSWPLNVGQVYTTLARLERDGLVEPALGADGSEDGKVTYRLTQAGRDALDSWFESPLEQRGRPRDELAIKLAMALTTPGVDVRRVVQTQRTSTLRALRDLTRLKAQADARSDMTWLLVHEAMILQTDAEARWLDYCDARLVGRPSAERLDTPARSPREVKR